MKKLTQFLTESKDTPLYDEWNIHEYFNYCLTHWYDNMRYTGSIVSMTNYQLIQVCKQCEIILTIIEKFADDINLYFISADENKDNNFNWTSENQLVNTFKIIEQLSNIDFSNGNEIKSSEESNINVKEEISELKSRFESIVKSCNDKWHKLQEKNKASEIGLGTPIPCDCECCKAGY